MHPRTFPYSATVALLSRLIGLVTKAVYPDRCLTVLRALEELRQVVERSG
jgi:hypothetical protein